jgi:hypothetical protein
MFLLGDVADIFQEGRLTRARLSGKEHGLASILYEVQCVLKLFVVGIDGLSAHR